MKFIISLLIIGFSLLGIWLVLKAGRTLQNSPDQLQRQNAIMTAIIGSIFIITALLIIIIRLFLYLHLQQII